MNMLLFVIAFFCFEKYPLIFTIISVNTIIKFYLIKNVKYVKIKLMKSVLKNLLLFLLFVSLMSCSLKYDDEEIFSESAPEFIFSGLEMNRVEDNKLTATLTARKLEQYRNDDAMYAENVVFSLYDDNGKINIEGTCNLLSADTKSKTYSLFGNVDVVSYEQDVSMKGENIHWDGKREQLVCGIEDNVEISTGVYQDSSEYASPKKTSSSKLQILGSGFSASGVSMNYQFQGKVSGTILTDTLEKVEEDFTLSSEEIAAEAALDKAIMKKNTGGME